MNTTTVSIVSVRPDPDRRLDLDLKHILSALAPFLSEWMWCIRNLDWLGDQGSEDLCLAVETAGRKGLWMSSQDLVDIANRVYQTIEGEFVAFAKCIDAETISSDDLALGCFPRNEAQLAIVAIDGGFFEVYAKDATFLMPFQGMRSTQQEDPSKYF